MKFNASIPTEYVDLFKSVVIKTIKIDENTKIEQYFYLFSVEEICLIKSFRQRKDQITAFASLLLKTYYLASILKTHPSKIKLKYNEYNRPDIANNKYKSWSFNISHSDDYIILVAINNVKYSIGVDVEKIDYAIKDIEQMSKIIFSKSEQEQICENKSYFFKVWTKKEALLKAKGEGFGSDFYKTTSLTIGQFDSTDGYVINTFEFDGYFISICLTSL